MEDLARTDPEIFAVIERERQRQLNKLEMIASENFVSGAVLQAQGSILPHKYAEGYPGRRFYGGCEYVDTAENLALNRVKELFGATYANVQPHSGTQANMAVYFSFLKPGDTILGMDLAHGGHLSHGAPVNFSGRLFKAVTYGVDRRTEEIDFEVVAGAARPQDPARPPGRSHPGPTPVRQGLGQPDLPGHPGRPAHAHHRRQGSGLQGS